MSLEIPMKKPSSLAQQIQQAQQEFNSWTPQRQANVRLAGSSALMTHYPQPRPVDSQPSKVVAQKK
jgi:hypothetical protein